MEGSTEGAVSRTKGRLMKQPAADPLAMLKNVDWLISNGGEISLSAVGPVECAAVASYESDCLVMLLRHKGESLYQLLTRLDAAIARARDEGEFTDEINSGC